jgi:hypothetical protein
VRTTTLTCISTAIFLLVGCKPKVPKEWEDVVPTDGLSKAYPSPGNPTLGDPPSVMMFYKRNKISSAQLRTNFKDKITKAGYEPVFECGNDPDRPSDGFAKAPKSFIDFSCGPLTPDTWDVRLQRSDALRSLTLPQNRGCKWLAAASKYCGGQPSGDTCSFPP